MIRRGDIYWVDFRGSVGAEIRKTRPAVVVSNTGHSECMRTVTVAPMSSYAGEVLPAEVAVPAGLVGDGRPARIKTHQIRAVDKSRLGRMFGTLPTPLLAALQSSICEHFGIEGNSA